MCATSQPRTACFHSSRTVTTSALAAGAERLTLGLAPLVASAASEPGQAAGSAAGTATNAAAGTAAEPAPADTSSPCWLRVAEKLAVRCGRRFYDFEGLYAFKRKFRPEAWEPVYLLCRQERLTARTFVALAGAFLGAGRSDAYRGWWSMPS